MAPIVGALLPGLIDIIKTGVERIFPDPAQEDKRKQAENEMISAVLDRANDLQKLAGEIIATEAASQHWLAANWRPLTMLFFVGLIGARWFGLSVPNMTEAEYLAVYDMIQIGLGGYVFMRSAEKILPSALESWKRK